MGALALPCVIAQAIVSLWLVSVWTWRTRLKTAFRPGNANDIESEFATYGFDANFMKAIGGLKSGMALLLGFAILPLSFHGELALLSSAVIVVLMCGATYAHYKVNDPFDRYVAGLCMLVLSAFILVVQISGGNTVGGAAGGPLRYGVGIVVLAADAAMWYQAYNNGYYKLRGSRAAPLLPGNQQRL